MTTDTILYNPQSARPSPAAIGQSIYRGVGYIETFDGSFWDSSIQREEKFFLEQSVTTNFVQNVATEYPPMAMVPAPAGVTQYFTIAPVTEDNVYANKNCIIVPDDFEGILSIILRVTMRSPDANARTDVPFFFVATDVEKTALSNGFDFAGFGQAATGLDNITLPAGNVNTTVQFPAIRLLYTDQTAANLRNISFFGRQNDIGSIPVLGSDLTCTLATTPA
jgi:hypothetical protein